VQAAQLIGCIDRMADAWRWCEPKQAAGATATAAAGARDPINVQARG
jgi:hypothetical protein